MKGILAQIPMNPDVAPMAQPARKIPIALEEQIGEQLRDLLRRGIIERSPHFSPWQSPLVVVMKKSGDFRICVHMRSVNKGVLRQPYPFPSFEKLTAQFHGSRIFSKLDIAQAFHQVELDPESRDVTTFVTSMGTF